MLSSLRFRDIGKRNGGQIPSVSAENAVEILADMSRPLDEHLLVRYVTMAGIQQNDAREEHIDRREYTDGGSTKDCKAIQEILRESDHNSSLFGEGMSDNIKLINHNRCSEPFECGTQSVNYRYDKGKRNSKHSEKLNAENNLCGGSESTQTIRLSHGRADSLDTNISAFCSKVIALFELYGSATCSRCSLYPALVLRGTIMSYDGDISLSVDIPIHRQSDPCIKTDLKLCYPFGDIGEYSLGKLSLPGHYETLAKCVDEDMMSFVSKPVDKATATQIIQELSRYDVLFEDIYSREVHLVG